MCQVRCHAKLGPAVAAHLEHTADRFLYSLPQYILSLAVTVLATQLTLRCYSPISLWSIIDLPPAVYYRRRPATNRTNTANDLLPPETFVKHMRGKITSG